MDRQVQQEHIRAAREWLGRAEDSLARENDVQGDLKLMLAKAELAHVGQCHRSRQLLVWGRRIAALLVAAGLAAGLFWAPAADIAENVPPQQEQTGASPPAALQTPVQQPEKAAPQPQEPAAAPIAPAAPQPAPEKAAPPAADREAVTVPAPQVKNALPDEAKQQLMQSAGKILRQ